jgi:RHS repeat-associated protein
MRSNYFFLVVVLATGIASSQVSTGTLPFGSFGGGPFDTVNLGNLNVHLAIPVLNKAGRGTAFSYNLSYDSSLWTPVSSNGTTSWVAALNWGWRGVTEVATGYFGYSFKLLKTCPPLQGSPKYGFEYQLSSFVYHDTFSVAHPFPATDTIETGTCGNSTPTIYSTATDGSGYTLYLYSTNGTTINSTVTSRGGKVIVSPFNLTTGPGNMTDANGNQLTANSSGQFFDTLSSTTPVLTVAGVGTPASPMTFTYPAPGDGVSSCNPITACASYTMNYTQYTVQTAFGVNNVKEYGPLSNPLVSSIKLPDGTSYAFTYEKTPGSCTPLSGTYTTNCVTGRIASIILPTGGEITYGYSGGSEGIESDGSTATLTRTLNPGGEWQYARSLSGSTWTTTITDPNQNQTIINFAEDGNTTAPTYNFYETQRQVKQLISGTQTLLATVIKCYNKVYASCATAAVSSPITQTDVYSELPNNSTRLSEVAYNSYGLVTDDKEYKYGVTMGSAPGTTDLVRETAINYASLGNGIVNKPSSVIVSDWTSGTAATLASTTYAYDGTAVTATTGTPQHTSITGSRGNLTTVTTSTSSTASLSKTFTYYDTGNPYVATDVNGAQTTYVYSPAANPYNSSLTASCGNSFATTINEPLSLSRSVQWNCTGGVAQQVTDENGQIVKTDYADPDFWRPADVYDQENNETTISYIGETAVEAALQNFNGGNSTSDSRTTVDGFGRIIFSQRKQGPSATNYDTGEIDYNNIGQPSRSTMPYSAVASPSSPNTTAPSINTTYDALGRVLTTTDADGGEVAYTYTNNDVLQVVSGTQTFQKQLEYDGLGRLTSVCEVTAGTTAWPGGTCGQSHQLTGYWTTYQYDALGRLLGVKQNAQSTTSSQTRAFTYDWLGRMTSESNPETTNTGTNGTKTYVYDATSNLCGNGQSGTNGDLVSTKDAAGNCAVYFYDALHRVTDVGAATAGGTSACKRFRYDNTQGVNGTIPSGITVLKTLGRVAEAETDSCVITNGKFTILTDDWFSYSPRGETTDVYELTPHSGSGVYYHTTAAYWPTGTLETLSGIPGVPTINYGAAGAGLDGEGRITQVTAVSGTNPVTGVTYSTSSTTNPLGALTGVTFGSADSDSFTYDPNTGRMTGYTFSVNGQTDVGALSWNSNGTLSQLKITDQIPGTSDSQTCNYMYDDLQRLSTANCGTPWSQTFTYDPFGNITKNGTLSFIPGYSPTTNQFTTIPGRNVSYDGNGNLLTDNLNTYTWDVFGHMSTVSTGSATVTATYDALGRMVENNAGGSYTEFVYGPTGAKLAKVNGTTLIKAFVALPGGAKAIYNSTGLAYYRHSDWLGSSRLTSTATKPTSMYSSSAYAPFGEQYATAGTADASFTGQDQDTVSSLYDFPARRYSPSQGRWISPDPAGRRAVSLTRPQSWNRYTYVNNNPLALIDAMGLSVRHRNRRARANEDKSQDPGDDDDDDDDSSGGGGGDDSSGDDNSGSDDNSGNNNTPCVGIGAGIDTNMDNSFLNQYTSDTGAAVVFPYDSSVPDGFGGGSWRGCLECRDSGG